MKLVKEFYKNKKILITGGAGFIGSHIAEELIKYDAQVTILDNFSTGNINNLLNTFPRINVLYGDITNPFTCINATKEKDFVFHLAALASVKQSIQFPEICDKINIEGTKNLLEGCIKNKVSIFVFSSSAAVYGNKNDHCKEDDQLDPLSPYAQSKIAGEQLCKKYSNEYEINTACLRYFNVYGERQNPDGEYAAVVAKFTENLKNKKPITIFGDGKQTRDFIHVSKVVEANLKIGMQKSLKGETYNIATGKSIDLFELIDKLEKETKNKKVNILFKPSRKGDILHSLANCTKYTNLLQK